MSSEQPLALPASRRQALRLLAGLTAGAAASVLAACGGGAAATVSTSAASASVTVSSAATSSAATSPATSSAATSSASSAAASVSSSVATSVAPASSGAAGKAALSMWTTWGDKDEVAEKALTDAFTKQQPDITVSLETVTDQNKFTAAMASGNPPDLLQTWNSALVATWATSGGVVQLDSYIQSSKLDPTTLDQGGLDAGKLFGKQYGMPMLVYTNTMLFWNKSLFQQAGLDPEKGPDTWETLNDYALKLTQKQGDSFKTIGFVPGGGPTGQGGVSAVMWSFGGQLYSDDGKQVTPDNPGVIKCAEFQRDQYKLLGGMDPINAFAKTFGKNDQDPFYVGQVAMEITGEWAPTFIAKYKPDLAYGLSTLPYDASAPQAKNSGNLGTNLIIIPKDSKHAPEAWQVIAFANTPDPDLALAKALGNTPQVVAAADMLAQQATTPALKYIVQAHKSPNMKATPINPVSNDYNKALSTAISDILSGKKPAPAALTEVKQMIQPKLDAIVNKS